MRRTLWLFVKIAVVVAIAVWLTNHPGTVRVDWQGWRIETSVGIAVLGGLVLIAVVALIYATWRNLKRTPRAIAAARRDRRRAAGYRALTEGLVAVAAGNPVEARRHARKADGLLKEPPLTLLLSAQAAQLSGETAAATRDFEAMLERPETEFLGLRGLIVQALKDDNTEDALALTRRAYALRPATPWVLETLIDLHSKFGDWRQTQKYLSEARRSKVITREDSETREAVLLAERARAANAAEQHDEALEQARRAHGLDPSLAPATVLLAQRVAAGGRARRARKIVQTGWAARPHPSLVPVYLEVVGATTALEQYSAVRELVVESADDVESRLALAEAATEAQLWGEARRQLEEIDASDVTARVYRLRARIAGADEADESTPGSWLDLAAGAQPDPAWVCNACGTVSDEWSGVCGNCGTLAGISWAPPPRLQRLAIATTAGTIVAAEAVVEPAAPGAPEAPTIVESAEPVVAAAVTPESTVDEPVVTSR